ncbi:uncharacterized protein V1513DRAFT_449016 [Lipomyces chichibuensis]|uniref:uncharacterized protein n=1 Tax=Lipomyces chichibuensis TaxID=1546026 RepID=UPI003342FDDB
MARNLTKYFTEASDVLSQAACIQTSQGDVSFDTIFYQHLKSQTGSDFVNKLEDDDDPQLFISNYLIYLLKRVDEASKDDQRNNPDLFSIALGDMKTINALLDFIVIECVYPCLTPGVGIPLANRRKDGNWRQKKLTTNRRVDILSHVVDTLVEIVESEDDIADLIMGGQYCTDIISGLAELGFSPMSSTNELAKYRKMFTDFLNRLQTFTLLSYITMLVHKDAPPWCLQLLTRTLAMIPISRPDDGVKSLIEMIGGLREDDHISVDKLDRAATVLCSIPKGVEPRSYFTHVGTQLLKILDDSQQKLLVSAAVQVIGSMRKSRPRVVTDFIFQPIIDSVAPKDDLKDTGDVLVSDTELTKAINRLSQLVRNSPPDTIEVLQSPVFYSLWALACFQRRTKRATDVTMSLLSVYIKTGRPDEKIDSLVHSIYYDGDDGWRYGNGENGQIEIRKRAKTYTELVAENDLIFGLEGIDNLEQRIDLVMELIDGLDMVSLRKIFLKTVRRWLVKRKDSTSDPFLVFTDLRLLEGILEKHRSEIIESPSEIIVLVSSILEDYVTALRDNHHNEHAAKPMSAQLAGIVPSETDEEPDSDDEDEEKEEMDTDSESVSVAVSLLSAMLSESLVGKTTFSSDDQRLLKSFGPSLKYISEHGPGTVSSSAATLALLLNETGVSTASSNSHLTESQQRYQSALNHLQDPLIPIRAYGLHLLRTLITERDPVVNVDSVLKIYLSTLKDEDSFIYLNSIKGLEALTDIHGIYVIKRLIAQYTAPDKSISLDERLRIGEAILRTVQRLGGALTGINADIIVHAMVTTVSNRKLDTRIRSSALSILGMACETNPSGLSVWVKDGIECALGVLTFESGENKTPLRRAAVVLVGSLLTGVRDLNEFPKEFAKEIVRSMRYIKSSDGDGLVRVQAGNVLDIVREMISEDLNVSQRDVQHYV